MLSSENALVAVARELEAPVPASEADGGVIFELSEGLRLGIYPVPDGSGFVAWSVASGARPGESPAEAEARAAAFLRAHLGRLRQGGAATATLGDDGAGLLYVRLAPVTEREWLEAVASLLNETETLRRILSASGGSAAAGGSGEMSLFAAGMSGLLRGR